MKISQFITHAKLLNKHLGFGKLLSYKTLYGTTKKTWGKRNASMWFVTYHTDIDMKINSIEVNTTYFKTIADKATAINKKLEAGETIEQILNLN